MLRLSKSSGDGGHGRRTKIWPDKFTRREGERKALPIYLGDLANNWAPAKGLMQLILGTLWNLSTYLRGHVQMTSA